VFGQMDDFRHHIGHQTSHTCCRSPTALIGTATPRTICIPKKISAMITMIKAMVIAV